MSQPIATYSFLPWLRQGLSNKIEEIDGASIKERASIKIGLNLNAVNLEGKDVEHKFEKDIRLFGPGDIVGIEQQAIIKTEPHNWITNFEPNYLPFIDFYDEDFPWRYTPAMPNSLDAIGKDRLRPWIALIVLKEGEFEDGKNLKDKPLPFVEVTNAATLFPPADQLWAWAHVHINKNIGINNDEIVSNDGTNVATRLQDLLNDNRDWAYSRILCPRHLEDNAAYHAFLMPVFETGRLAGLGLDQTKAPKATTSAWDMAYPNRAESPNFPYYHRWYFRTGTVGDFEYLVRLLKPQPVDSRVGTRDMDVQAPAPYLNIHGITHPDLGGV